MLKEQLINEQNYSNWPFFKNDRIPVFLYYDFFAAVRQNISPALFALDPAASRKAVVKTFFETGADGFVIGRLPDPFSYAAGGFPNRIRLPGRDLPEQSMWQFEEIEETINVDDYDYIFKHGWNSFLPKLLPRFTELKAEQLPDYFQRSRSEGRLDLEAWQKAAAPILCGAAATAPFEILTAGRTIFKFFEGLYLRPEKVKAAMEAMLPDIIEGAIKNARNNYFPAVVITAHRSCGSIISLRHFEKFAFPYLKTMVDSFSRAGLGIMLHLDCDWTKNIAYFSDFPDDMIIHTDGTTDLRRARQILKETIILMDDLPALLLARGKTGQVEEYTIKLIEDIAGDNNYILSSGCDVSMDAKLENVQAMVRIAGSSAKDR